MFLIGGNLGLTLCMGFMDKEILQKHIVCEVEGLLFTADSDSVSSSAGNCDIIQIEQQCSKMKKTKQNIVVQQIAGGMP